MAERLLAGLVAVPFLLGAAAAPTDRSEVAFTFQDAAIVESSGLAVAGALVVTTNDSGDTGRVFAVDPRTGATVGTTRWAEDVEDVEALAPAADREVWVGDIGDNLERRDTIRVARVPVGRGEADVEVGVYELAYPDGAHDAETLLCDPSTGRLYVATKSVLGGTLYAAPAELDPGSVNRLEPVGDVLPLATDGAFLAGGARLVVRNYGTAVVYAFPSLEKLDQLRLPAQPQGEGIAAAPDGSLLLSSEGLHTQVLRLSLPTPAPDTPSPASPAASSPTGPPPAEAEDQQPSAAVEARRAAWPWLVGGLVGAGALLVLVRSLRRR